MKRKIQEYVKKYALRLLDTGMENTVGVKKCAFFGLCFFLGSLAVSYFAFRDREFSLSVRLAKTKNVEQFPQTFDTEGELKAPTISKILAPTSARIDQLKVKSGDAIKKDQVIAILNEKENRELLLNAINQLNAQTEALSSAKQKLRSQKITLSAFKEIESEVEKSRQALQSANENVQRSIIRSPADGAIWLLKSTVLGAQVAQEAPIAEVIDPSKLSFSVTLPSSEVKRLGSQCPIQIHPKGDKENTESHIQANIHFASARSEAGTNKTKLDLTFPADSIPTTWLHETMQVKMTLPPLKKVALVDSKAVFSKGSETGIFVLSPSGVLRWRKISHVAPESSEIVVKESSQNIRVVVPDDAKALEKAVALGVRPKVLND